MIDPSISLAVKSPQVETPLDTMSKTVSIADMLSQMGQRKTQTAQQQFALQEAKSKQQEQDAIESAIGRNATVDDQGQTTINHRAVLDNLPTPKLKAKYQALIPQLDKEALDHSTDRLAMRHQAIQSQMALASEAKAAIDAAPDDASKQQAWSSIIPKWSALDSQGAQQLPRQYDPATVDTLLTGVIAHGQAENDKSLTSLQIAEAKKSAADAMNTLSKIQPSTPEGALAKATRMADISTSIDQKYPNLDQETRDSIKESTGLPKVVRKTPPRITSMAGTIDGQPAFADQDPRTGRFFTPGTDQDISDKFKPKEDDKEREFQDFLKHPDLVKKYGGDITGFNKYTADNSTQNKIIVLQKSEDIKNPGVDLATDEGKRRLQHAVNELSVDASPANVNLLIGSDRKFRRQVDDELAIRNTTVQQLTTQTKQMAQTAKDLIPTFDATIKKINTPEMQAKLGPILGRWNDFEAGKIGAGDPDFQKLKTTVDLLKTGTMRAHFGARGGTGLLARFDDLADTGKMDPATLTATLEGMRDFLNDTYVKPHTPVSNSAQPSTADDFLKKHNIK